MKFPRFVNSCAGFMTINSGSTMGGIEISINAQITGSGDIICHGNPDIQKTNTTGSGDVKIIN